MQRGKSRKYRHRQSLSLPSSHPPKKCNRPFRPALGKFHPRSQTGCRIFLKTALFSFLLHCKGQGFWPDPVLPSCTSRSPNHPVKINPVKDLFSKNFLFVRSQYAGWGLNNSYSSLFFFVPYFFVHNSILYSTSRASYPDKPITNE